MKKVFTLLLFAIISLAAYSQQVKEHTVLRGETPESVAAKYGITVDALKAENPSINNFFYVGMTLAIPQQVLVSDNKSDEKKAEPELVKNDVEVDSVAIVQAQLDELLERIRKTDQYWEEGDQAFASGNYKKAEKKYTKALELGGDDPDILYNRALCSLRRDKYNHAIDDFKACLRNDPDDELREQANTMLDLAKDLKSERADRRGKIIGGALLLAAGTALAVTEASMMQQQFQSGNNPYSSNMFMPYSSMPATNEYSIYAQRDAYYTAELAKSNMQMMQINAMRMELARQQHNEADRVLQMKSNAINISAEALSKYTLNPSDYSNPDFAFYEVFSEKMERGPSIEEMAVFKDYYASYISALMENSGSGSSLSSSSDDDSDYSFSSSSSTWDYQAEYNQIENRVKSNFNTRVIMGGVSAKDESGKTNISLDASAPIVPSAMMSKSIIDDQREMRKVREEARKHGVTIIVSEWETKQPSYY